eukprot:463376-Hanusia_phi.AAC.2
MGRQYTCEFDRIASSCFGSVCDSQGFLGSFGVFDGHGGRDCAEFLKSNITSRVRELEMNILVICYVPGAIKPAVSQLGRGRLERSILACRHPVRCLLACKNAQSAAVVANMNLVLICCVACVLLPREGWRDPSLESANRFELQQTGSTAVVCLVTVRLLLQARPYHFLPCIAMSSSFPALLHFISSQSPVAVSSSPASSFSLPPLLSRGTLVLSSAGEECSTGRGTEGESRRGKILQLSRDHKPNRSSVSEGETLVMLLSRRPDERMRIEQLGGRQDGYASAITTELLPAGSVIFNRVMGRLGVSRVSKQKRCKTLALKPPQAFGDASLKKYVTAEPEVTSFP